MLGCFVIGLIWICIFYVFSNDSAGIPVFNDLGQNNLLVGIGFMAVGFTFATRWEWRRAVVGDSGAHRPAGRITRV